MTGGEGDDVPFVYIHPDDCVERPYGVGEALPVDAEEGEALDDRGGIDR